MNVFLACETLYVPNCENGSDIAEVSLLMDTISIGDVFLGFPSKLNFDTEKQLCGVVIEIESVIQNDENRIQYQVKFVQSFGYLKTQLAQLTFGL